MKCLIAASLLSVLLFVPVETSADGLIYQLPDDGTSVTFDLHGSFEQQGRTMTMTGTFHISSVGRETVDDVPCRWIEFKMSVTEFRMGTKQTRQRTLRAKALIPEAELKQGKAPIDHVLKGWYKTGDDEPREITDIASGTGGGLAGPLPAFLCGPFKDFQKKDPATVKSGLGEYKCEVTTGSTSFQQTGTTQKYTFTNYERDSAPFGLVKSEIQIEVERNGEAAGSGTLTLVAEKVGQDAQSEIPNGR